MILSVGIFWNVVHRICYKTLALNANQVRFDNNSFVLRIGPGVEGIVRELSGRTYLSQEDDEEGK
jgi:hypothetical protein